MSNCPVSVNRIPLGFKVARPVDHFHVDGVDPIKAALATIYGGTNGQADRMVFCFAIDGYEAGDDEFELEVVSDLPRFASNIRTMIAEIETEVTYRHRWEDTFKRFFAAYGRGYLSWKRRAT